MSRWIVKGARKSDGRVVTAKIVAATAEEAERKANGHGLLVESIDLEGALHAESSIADRLASIGTASANGPTQDEDAASPESELEPFAGQSLGAPTPAGTSSQVSYARSPSTSIPDYAGLRLAGSVLRACAYVYYVLAAIVLIIALLVLGATLLGMGVTPAPVGRTNPFAPPPPAAIGLAGVLGASMPVIFGLCLFAFGAILHGLSAACAALRDIARNSWNR